jgi:hypothetical protein
VKLDVNEGDELDNMEKRTIPRIAKLKGSQQAQLGT